MLPLGLLLATTLGAEPVSLDTELEELCAKYAVVINANCADEDTKKAVYEMLERITARLSGAANAVIGRAVTRMSDSPADTSAP